MRTAEWEQYYSYLVERGGMKPEKRAEMVVNCGGKLRKLIEDPITKVVKGVEETEEEAEERVVKTIKTRFPIKN